MDKQLVLRAMRLTQCRFMPYIEIRCFPGSILSRLIPAAVLSVSAGHGYTYLDLNLVQRLRMTRNFLNLLKTHHKQLLLEI